jgi:hypothetical protein
MKEGGKLGRLKGAEVAVPEGEKRRTLTAELWAVPLGTRPLWKVAVGRLLSEPSDDMTQICRSRNAAAPVRKRKCAAEMDGGRSRQWRWRIGEGKRDLDVVVGAGGGEAAGGGVEVEAEHRLQVVPVDLHRPAPHLCPTPLPSPRSMDGFLLRRVAFAPNLSLFSP